MDVLDYSPRTMKQLWRDDAYGERKSELEAGGCLECGSPVEADWNAKHEVWVVECPECGVIAELDEGYEAEAMVRY